MAGIIIPVFGYLKDRKNLFFIMSLAFSDTTAKLGIIQSCENYTNLGDAGISGNATYLKEFTRYINESGSRVWSMIFSAYGGWQYEDANQTNLPAASDTLTSGQTSYALPSGSLTVRGIEVKDTGGVWRKLNPITEEQIRDRQAMGEFYKTAATPLFYQMIGQTVRIFPAANWTQSESFKVFFDRGSVAFTSTDTTATPGFASEFHGILPIMASIQWLISKRPDSSNLALLRQEEANYIQRLKQFYQEKFHQMFPPRITTADIIREYR